MVAIRCQKILEAPHEPVPFVTFHEAGSAGTFAGELPVELFAGKGAGAPGNGSWVLGFNARIFRGILSPALILHFVKERELVVVSSCARLSEFAEFGGGVV